MLAVENQNKKDAQKNRLMLPNKLKISEKLEDNLLQGYGSINLNNKFIYQGNFKDGFFHGEGDLSKYDNWGDLITIKSGEFFDGELKMGILRRTTEKIIGLEDTNITVQSLTLNLMVMPK